MKLIAYDNIIEKGRPCNFDVNSAGLYILTQVVFFYCERVDRSSELNLSVSRCSRVVPSVLVTHMGELIFAAAAKLLRQCRSRGVAEKSYKIR